MLNLIGSIAGLMTVGVMLVVLTTALDLSLARRLTLGAIFAGWVGLALDFGASGALAFAPDSPVPVIGLVGATPPLVVGVLALVSQSFRSALLAIPTSFLIGVNAMRAFGVLFLLLALEGRLAGPFPFVAGPGDIITGLVALPLAISVARSRTLPGAAIARWNAFGALDLIVAVGLGLTSANGSPLQVIHWGVGSEAIQQLPFCLVPTVLVPFYLITHAIVAAQLIARRPAGALAQV